MESVLTFVLKDTKVRDNLRRSIRNTLDRSVQNAQEELAKLLQDEQGRAITYNHYYTHNIQRARHDDAKARIKKSVDDALHEEWGGRFHFTN